MKLFLKIIGFSLVGLLIIALILALNGVEEVGFNDTYYKFFYSVSHDYDAWKLEIPRIPTIDKLEGGEWWALILNAFINFVNGLFGFLNVIIMILNYVIQLIQFIATFLASIFYRLPELLENSVPILHNNIIFM